MDQQMTEMFQTLMVMAYRIHRSFCTKIVDFSWNTTNSNVVPGDTDGSLLIQLLKSKWKIYYDLNYLSESNSYYHLCYWR